MEIAIVKYNAGNIRSVLFALERLNLQARVTDDPAALRAADKVIFPGVGAAGTAMEYLRARGLHQVIAGLTQPVLGICLGMQLLCRHSEENDTHCIGIFDEPVKRFPDRQGFKVPQIGWNDIYDLKSPLFEGIPEKSFVYLVHSYYAAVGPHTIATSDYIVPFSVALQRDNFYGVQCHPEKSAEAGEALLRNFIYNIQN